MIDLKYKGTRSQTTLIYLGYFCKKLDHGMNKYIYSETLLYNLSISKSHFLSPLINYVIVVRFDCINVFHHYTIILLLDGRKKGVGDNYE